MVKIKGGRPTKDESELKSHFLKIRCTKSDKEKIKSFAKNLDVSLTDYVVYSCLRKDIIPQKMELLSSIQKLSSELNKSGNNVNQATRQINFQKESKRIDPILFANFQSEMEIYNRKVDELNKCFRSLIRSISH